MEGLRLGVWGTPFETQGKAVLCPNNRVMVVVSSGVKF